MNSGALSKKQEHLQLKDPANGGDAWIWRAIALPNHLRVATHLSHERSEEEAKAFLAAFKSRTDGRPPLCTPGKLHASTAALIATYSTRLSYLQLNTAVVVLARHRVGCWIRTCFTHRLTNDARKDVSLSFADGSSSVRQKSSLKCSANNRSTLPTVEHDNLTSRQSNGRLVRKTLSHSKKSYFLWQHLELEDAFFNFVRPHQALRIALSQPTLGRKWQSDELQRWRQD